MADESEQAAERDVTATTASYGGPVSDQELADVYLPEGQNEVQDTASQPPAAGDAPAPDAPTDRSDTGTADATPDEPAIEPTD